MPENYPRSELLCDTAWLQQHLDDPAIRIIDCGMPDAYNRAHILGAVGLPHPYLKGKDSPFIMDTQEFSELMAVRGVSNDTLVILYDDNASLYAARVWWCLDHYGHTSAKVLNGGFNKWLYEKRPLTAVVPHPELGRFRARAKQEGCCTLDGLRQGIGDPNVVIWDTRSQEEWTGENDRGNKRKGRVPGAVHLEWRHLMEGPPERKFKPAEELRRMFAGLGITPEKRVVTY